MPPCLLVFLSRWHFHPRNAYELPHSASASELTRFYSGHTMPNKLLERLRSCLSSPDRPVKRSLYTTTTPPHSHRRQEPLQPPMEVAVSPSVMSERTTPSDQPNTAPTEPTEKQPGTRSPRLSSVRWDSSVPDRPGTPIVPLELDLPPPIDLGFGSFNPKGQVEQMPRYDSTGPLATAGEQAGSEPEAHRPVADKGV